MKKMLLYFIFVTLGIGALIADGTQPTGSGTSLDPYQVSTLDHLLWISTNSVSWGSYFEQTADIDASATSGWNAGAGFSPIGVEADWFWGSYDGQNHTISNLYINLSGTDYIGLFGFINDASIHNLGVTNVDITGQNNVGGLVGSNSIAEFTVSNCYSTGSVSGTDGVGGLVGENSYSTVSNSYSSASVSGNDYVGGLVGINTNNSTINNCYSTGSVNGDWGSSGGLVGYNGDFFPAKLSVSDGNVSGQNWVGGLIGIGNNISNSYSRGDVTRTIGGGGPEIGGFCGNNAGPIEHCFSTGSVYYTGTTDPTDAGFIGSEGDGSSYTNNFWDSDASNQTTATGATAKTTAEMKTVATFTALATAGLSAPVWDFETNPNDDVANNDYWDIDLSGIPKLPVSNSTEVGIGKVISVTSPMAINDSYPFLGWQNGADIALPVELSSFTVEATNQGVLCKWTTESEVENLGFLLERKTEGTDWKKIVSYKTNDGLLGQGTISFPTDYEYLDELVQPNTTYEYRLADVDYNGIITYHSTRVVTVEQTPLASVVEEFTVLPAYPNPFNPSTTIRYGIPVEGTGRDLSIQIAIYDITGKLITILFNGEQSPGWHSILWNGTNQHGEQVPAGLYFSRIKSGNDVKTAKLMLLK